MYCDNIENKKVAVLGVHPPPLGGVSVHIERVIHTLRQQHNNVYHFDTTLRKNNLEYALRLVWFLFKTRPNILYYHSIDLNHRLHEFRLLIYLKYILRSTLVIVEHNCRHLYDRTLAYKKNFNELLQEVDQLVLIGQPTYTEYRDNGITFPKKWSIESAFLPPAVDDERSIFAAYPPSLHEFMEQHNPLIAVNAYQCVLLRNKDLYGLDLSIQALHALKKSYPKTGLIIVLGAIGDQEHFNILQEMITKYALETHIYFLIGQHYLWPLLKKANLFIRPTLSDAASVSIEEALYFGTPVIASDAVERPESVTLFRSGDSHHLCETIKRVVATQ